MVACLRDLVSLSTVLASASYTTAARLQENISRSGSFPSVSPASDVLLVRNDPSSGASGPVPNLPPDKQCANNCPGGPSVSPESDLAVYVFGTPGCSSAGGLVAATAYSKDVCGWHYGGFCPTAPCTCDPGATGCVHGTMQSILLPPGASVKLWAQCNIIYHCEPATFPHAHADVPVLCIAVLTSLHAWCRSRSALARRV